MQAERAPLSVAEYLAGEAKSPLKHEYVDGHTYAMSGASRRHNEIASNLHILAGNAAKRIDHCRIFSSDMKLYVEERNCMYYPDLTVTCDPGDDDPQYLSRPCFVVEVLSPSTACTDHREKRISYETLPSLKEYLIVEQKRMRVFLHFRRAGVWLVQVLMDPEDIVRCSCLNLQLTLREIYEGVELPPFRVEEPALVYGDRDRDPCEPVFDFQ